MKKQPKKNSIGTGRNFDGSLQYRAATWSKKGKGQATRNQQKRNWRKEQNA